MEKAGFAQRFIAWFIDGLAIGIIGGILLAIIGVVAGLGASSDSSILGFLTATLTVIGIVVVILMQFFYFGYFWSRSGSSLGMKLFSIEVVRRQPGEPISFLRGALRGSLGYWISGLVFSLGYIWAAFDAEKEAWHDKIFDTWVVKK